MTKTPSKTTVLKCVSAEVGRKLPSDPNELRQVLRDAVDVCTLQEPEPTTYRSRQPPAGSGLQMQASLTGGGGQTYFAGGSPQRRGKIAAKRTPMKREKKGSGSLAMFGVMPEGQATL